MRKPSRVPRGPRRLVNETYGGVLGVDPATGRSVLTDPETGEPLIRADGQMVYDPPLTEVLLFALQHGVRGKHQLRFLVEWLRYAAFVD